MLASTLGGLSNSPICDGPPGEAWSDFLDTKPGRSTYVFVFSGNNMGKCGAKIVRRAAPTRLLANGKQGHPRRTPQHIAYPAGSCDTYNPHPYQDLPGGFSKHLQDALFPPCIIGRGSMTAWEARIVGEEWARECSR